MIGDRQDAYICLYSSAVGLVTDADDDADGGSNMVEPASVFKAGARQGSVQVSFKLDTVKGCGGDKGFANDMLYNVS